MNLGGPNNADEPNPEGIRADHSMLFSESFLRSRSRSEVPDIQFDFVEGAVYPTAAQLSRVLVDEGAEIEPGAAALRYCCPIVRLAGVQARDVLYGRSIVLSNAERNTHFGIFGLTGTGKNTKVFDALLDHDLKDDHRICVVVALKPETYGLCQAHALKDGIPVYYFNANDNARSTELNILETGDPVEAENLICSFADQSVNPYSREVEFWRQNGTNYMLAGWHAGYRSFPSLFELFSHSPNEIADILGKCPHPTARAACSFLRSGSQNADTVLATIVGWLRIFQNPTVQSLTQRHELPDDIFRRRCVIFVQCDESMLSSLRAVYNMLIQWLLQRAIKVADADLKAPDRPSVSFYFDDLPAWGAIAGFADKLATLRARRICVIAAIQSMAHLCTAYGPEGAETLAKSLVNKVIMPGADQTDAEYYARYTGEQTVAYPEDGGATLNRNILRRHALTSSDIRCPKWEHFLLGKPLTFILRDVVFQAYVPPLYLRPDAVETLAEAAANPMPPKRTVPLPASESGELTVPSTKTGFTDVRGWSEDRIWNKIAELKKQLDIQNATASAVRWWEAFERENKHRAELIVRLLDELMLTFSPPCTITEFFLAYVYSNTDSISANIAFARYCRLKKENDHRRKQDAHNAKNAESLDSVHSGTSADASEDDDAYVADWDEGEDWDVDLEDETDEDRPDDGEGDEGD